MFLIQKFLLISPGKIRLAGYDGMVVWQGFFGNGRQDHKSIVITFNKILFFIYKIRMYLIKNGN